MTNAKIISIEGKINKNQTVVGINKKHKWTECAHTSAIGHQKTPTPVHTAHNASILG